MSNNNLSDSRLRALKGREKPFKISDGGGLHVLVTTKGSRLWRLAYRFGGKQKLLALGIYPYVTLAEARDGRDEAKRMLRSGVDPSAARKVAKRTSASRERTFAVVAQRWLAARKLGWVPAYAERVWSRVEDDLISRLGDRPIGEIEAWDLLAALRAIEQRGSIETAHRVRNYASDIFRYAKSERLVTANPAEELGHALTTAPPVQRRIALKARDLPGFLGALFSYPTARTRLAIWFTLLTFVRTAEVRFARWDEFEGLDSEQALWRIPPARMKMRNEHLVPLSAHAVDALTELRQLSGNSAMVFPAATQGGVMSENAMLSALTRMNYKGVATVHGFRGTASTILNENGFNRDWIERQLAHTERDAIRAAYNSAEWLSERRGMMQWWADYLSRLAAGAS